MSSKTVRESRILTNFEFNPRWPTNWSVQGEGRGSKFRSYCHSGVICIVEMHRFRSKPPLQVWKLPFSRSSAIEDSLRVSLGLREDTPEETEALIKGRRSLSSILYPCLYAASLRFFCLDWDSIVMCKEILYKVWRNVRRIRFCYSIFAIIFVIKVLYSIA